LQDTDAKTRVMAMHNKIFKRTHRCIVASEPSIALLY
jgi:hypothetical protein